MVGNWFLYSSFLLTEHFFAFYGAFKFKQTFLKLEVSHG